MRLNKAGLIGLFGLLVVIVLSVDWNSGSTTTPTESKVDPPQRRTPVKGRLLVTGGLGCVGSGVLRELTRAGYTLVVVDISNATEAINNVEFVQGEIRDVNLLRNKILDCEGVVHLAGMSRVSWCEEQPQECAAINVKGTQAVLDAIEWSRGYRKDRSTPWIIYTSSSAVFAGKESFPVNEETAPEPTSIYGQTKLEAESRIQQIARASRLSAIILRLSHVYGCIRDHEDRLIPQFVRNALKGNTLMAAGKERELDFVYISDVSSAVLAAVQRVRSNGKMNPGVTEIFNIGGAVTVTIETVAAAVISETGGGATVRNLFGDSLYIQKYNTSIDKARSILNWSPKVTNFRDGLKEYIRVAQSRQIQPFITQDTYDRDSGITKNLELYGTTSTNLPKGPSDDKVVIIGAGVGGICAAMRLQELGHTNWEIIEGSGECCGLASSFTDEKGFIWDVGVHVLFSHYGWFDRLLDHAIPTQDWAYHWRVSKSYHTWKEGMMIDYPFQNNLYSLPEDILVECLRGLAQVTTRKNSTPPANYREWLLQSFGPGVSNTFMIPYNFKVWATPTEKMNSRWVGERVATPDLAAILENTIRKQTAPSWGPNAIFRYPMNGTGQIWEAVFKMVDHSKVKFNTKVAEVGDHVVKIEGGKSIKFDKLISTMPMETLTNILAPNIKSQKPSISGFVHQTVNLIGLGVRGKLPDKLKGVHWLYFSEEQFPFYRVTVLSNFAPPMVPGKEYYSLLCEVSESTYRRVDQTDLLERVKTAYIEAGMLPAGTTVVSEWRRRYEYGYPVPYLERDDDIHPMNDFLLKRDIWSRGRFGGWKYEVANQDHTCMEGYEAADAAVLGLKELTWYTPDKVNGMYRPHTSLVRNSRDRIPIMDFVVPHCDESLKWIEALREEGVPKGWAFRVILYERCKTEKELERMKGETQDMWDAVHHILHHIYTPPKGAHVRAWQQYVVQTKEPADVVVFLQSSTDNAKGLARSIRKAAENVHVAGSFGFERVGGDTSKMTRVELGSGFVAICQYLIDWPNAKCPSNFDVQDGAAFVVSRQRLRQIPRATWDRVEEVLDGKGAGGSAHDDGERAQSVERLLHVLFGKGTSMGAAA